MDDNLPDLVRDWELDTKFVSDKQTIHTTYVSDPARGRWRRAEEEVWDQTSMLGRGSFGVVSLQKCVSGPNSGKVRAVKEIQVTLDRSVDKFLSREISAIIKFSHKRFRDCFVPSLGWYRGKDSIFITMEYLPLGDLESFLDNPLPDSEARTITEQVLQGIDFMHGSKVAHRDLKPKNILVQNNGPNWWVKISDFGCSKQSESTSLRTIIGTEPYLAPELQNVFAPSDQDDIEDEEDSNSLETLAYTLAVDIWALGAIAFRIATGHLPFPSPIGKRLFRYVAQGGPFPSNELLSTECHDFIVSVMSRSPRDRPAAATALKHAWIASRRGIERARFISEADITSNSHTDRITRPNSPQTTSDEASGSWTTVQQSLTIRQKPPPGGFDPKERSSAEFLGAHEASDSWSTVQRDPTEGSPTVPTTIKRTQSQGTPVLQLLPLKLTDAWNTGNHEVPTACAFSVDGQWLFSTTYNRFHLWKQTDQGGFNETIDQMINCYSIQAVAVSSNDRHLISHHGYVEGGSYVRSWEVTFVDGLFQCLLKSRWGADWGAYPFRRVSANARRVLEVKHTKDGLAKITILGVSPGGSFTVLRSQKSNFTAEDICLSADGEHYIVFHDEKCTIFSCEHTNGSEFQLWSSKKRAKLGWVKTSKTATFSLDGRWCIIWYNQVFRIFRRVSGKWEAGLQVGFDAEAAAFSVDSKRLAIGSAGGAISIWMLESVSSLTLDKRMQLQTQGELRYITFSPDGQFLATDAVGKFQVWKIF